MFGNLWRNQRPCLEACGVTSYNSGWRKDVVNRCLQFVSICRSMYLTLYLSVYVPGCLSVGLCTWLSICLSMYLTVYLSVYVPDCLSLGLCTWLSVSRSVYLFVSVNVGELNCILLHRKLNTYRCVLDLEQPLPRNAVLHQYPLI